MFEVIVFLILKFYLYLGIIGLICHILLHRLDKGRVSKTSKNGWFDLYLKGEFYRDFK